MRKLHTSYTCKTTPNYLMFLYSHVQNLRFFKTVSYEFRKQLHFRPVFEYFYACYYIGQIDRLNLPHNHAHLNFSYVGIINKSTQLACKLKTTHNIVTKTKLFPSKSEKLHILFQAQHHRKYYTIFYAAPFFHHTKSVRIHLSSLPTKLTSTTPTNIKKRLNIFYIHHFYICSVTKI